MFNLTPRIRKLWASLFPRRRDDDYECIAYYRASSPSDVESAISSPKDVEYAKFILKIFSEKHFAITNFKRRI